MGFDDASPAAAADEAAARKRGGGLRDRPYKGIRMRKWGKWVAEVREPNKRSRIWLGSYSTPVAAARAYDTAVFYLRGPSARINFPEFLAGSPVAGGADLPASFIRRKATEVGTRVDAALGHGVASGGGIGVGMGSDDNDMCGDREGNGDYNDSKRGILLRVDLNEVPVPEESDGDSEEVWDKDHSRPKNQEKERHPRTWDIAAGQRQRVPR
ncbi:hypothetical protein MLD38_030919 [Melastoma candidum]|uniref:Uncharacterized protein n=1 Tax=Melastoma candidum TaxID=119954 RepID=A0ACB9MRP3_9MYRT|nr:hypothetical protein MLD38_030919 [Melastoma candidum]